jgi:hypothetical protein
MKEGASMETFVFALSAVFLAVVSVAAFAGLIGSLGAPRTTPCPGCARWSIKVPNAPARMCFRCRHAGSLHALDVHRLHPHGHTVP